METCVSYQVTFSHSGPIRVLIGASSPSIVAVRAFVVPLFRELQFFAVGGEKIDQGLFDDADRGGTLESDGTQLSNNAIAIDRDGGVHYWRCTPSF